MGVVCAPAVETNGEEELCPERQRSITVWRLSTTITPPGTIGKQPSITKTATIIARRTMRTQPKATPIIRHTTRRKQPKHTPQNTDTRARRQCTKESLRRMGSGVAPESKCNRTSGDARAIQVPSGRNPQGMQLIRSMRWQQP